MNSRGSTSQSLRGVHRTIFVVDIEGFGDRRRTNSDQVTARTGLYRALDDSFRAAGIRRADCHEEDRGDGVFLLAPPDIPKGVFVESLPLALAEALRRHNQTHRAGEQIRLRCALHAGEVNYDDHGVTGAAINVAFRLVDAPPLKAALADSPGMLAFITSSWFYEEVVRHAHAVDPATFRPVEVAVKELRTTGWICLPDHPYPPRRVPDLPSSSVPVPQQLPIATRHFAGRATELAVLTGLMQEVGVSGGAVVISAIDGTAGIGKTALAVHWAHHVAGRFPDGQLYVNLRGFDPAAPPTSPAEVVHTFLDALGVPPERIPVNLDGQTSLYRSLMADRRVLVVLDNARDADQVRPLLPGSSGCLVIVTSRNRLTSLVTAEGAHPVTLDLLTPEESTQLLRRRLGSPRIAAEPQAVQEIIEHCARLPLALSIVAARAASHPTFLLEALAAELQVAQGGLDFFDASDPAANVRALFSWSYRQLDSDTASVFRRLGLHPGPDISVPAATSLSGLPAGQVRRALAELAHAHLISEHDPGRYTFHDLLRAYAAELGNTADPEPERRAAISRMIDHYLYTAHDAALLIHQRRTAIDLPTPQPGVQSEKPADLASAMAWFETEHPVLLGIVHLAAAERHPDVWQLPWIFSEYLERRGHWRDNVTTNTIALSAAVEQGNQNGQAHAHCALGRAYPWLGRYDDANDHLRQALVMFEQLDDQVGQANTFLEFSWMFEHRDQHAEALNCSQRASALFETAGHQSGRVRAFYRAAFQHTLLGHHDEAFFSGNSALTLCRQLGDRRSESHTLSVLGLAHHNVGNHHDAVDCYRQSIKLHRELGDHYHQATVNARLADTLLAMGDEAAARDAWQQALEILDQLRHIIGPSRGYPDADLIRTKLSHLVASNHGAATPHPE